RIVTNMLVMTAIEFGPPMVFAILVESGYSAFHRRREPAGFHQRKMVSAINQHISDAATSGSKCFISPASAASTVADSIQSCAMLIITSRTSRACQTAERPTTTLGLSAEYFLLGSCIFIRLYHTDRPNFGSANLQIDPVQRTRRRTVENVSGG